MSEEATKTLKEEREEKAIPCSSSTTFTSSSDEDDGDEVNGGAIKKKKKNKELDVSFDLAASRVASAATSGKLSDSHALKLYGFYKQALEGDCKSSRPAIWDRKGRAKWDAWTAAAGTPKEEAKKRYVELTESLLGPEEKDDGAAGGGAGAGATTAAKRATGGGAGGSRFGPVFSTPASGDAGEEAENDDEDDEDEDDDVVMCPLSVAAAADDAEAIADLISRGEDPRCARDGGDEASTTTTPLHWAADKGALRAAAALADAGSPLDARDADGLTPLHYACLCGRKEIAELLVSRGADVDAVDSDGQRARDKAPRCWGGGWP